MRSRDPNAIYWIEVENITPNPYQPRTDFNDESIRALSDSVKQYGILQPLVATPKEIEDGDGGFIIQYELIAGERRLRASKMAGLATVPVIIKSGIEEKKAKLELAIIENLQREDLNPIDKANAFKKLVDEFNLKHHIVAERVGKSREYVTNSIRLLCLSQDMLDAMKEGKITEGHARPLLLLKDKLLEQRELFNEMVARRLTVRDSERIAKRMMDEKDLRLQKDRSPRIRDFEKSFEEVFGTRVYIESKKMGGGKILIDFVNQEDLDAIFERIRNMKEKENTFDESNIKIDDFIMEDDNEDNKKEKKEDDFYSFNNFSI